MYKIYDKYKEKWLSDIYPSEDIAWNFVSKLIKINKEKRLPYDYDVFKI